MTTRNCFFCHNFKVCEKKGTIVRVTKSLDDVERYIPGLHNDCLTWFVNPPTGEERDNDSEKGEDSQCGKSYRQLKADSADAH